MFYHGIPASANLAGMSDIQEIFVGAGTGSGAGDADQYLLLKYGNRHGLVAGATGTGKTVTLQVMAEGLSRAGVPVFAADVKGDFLIQQHIPKNTMTLVDHTRITVLRKMLQKARAVVREPVGPALNSP